MISFLRALRGANSARLPCIAWRNAEGVGPYAGCGADSPGKVVMGGASCRVVEDADPYDGIIQNRM